MKAPKNICIATLCFLALCFNTGAQQIQRQVAISAYIYNFAKNIEWQNEESIEEFHFMIFGQDESLVQEMTTMSKMRKLRDKPIKISSSKTLYDLDNVQLIFVLKGDEANIVDIFDKIEGKNILLITDRYLDKRLIMINFYNSDKGTLLFEINKANIINQRLKIMQDMILLGGTEIDVAALYQEGQQSLRNIQKHSDALEKNLSKLESDLDQLEKTVLLKNKEVIDDKDSLASLSVKIAGQQNVLDKQSKLLNQRETEMDLQIKKMKEQQKISDLQTKELNAQTLNLKKGNEILLNQKKDIVSQKIEIQKQSKILSDQGLTIHRQRNLMFLLIIIILLVVILVISIYSGYKGKKKMNKELENRVNERTYDLNVLNEQLRMELTERKLAESSLRISEERYRYLFERNPAPMLIYGQETLKLLAVNEAFLNHYGYSTGEALSMFLPDLYPIEEKVPIVELSKSLSGHAYVGEWHHNKKDGSTISIIATSHDLVYMGKASRVAVITDITARKKAEEEVKELNLNLENRVAERTTQLVEINKELESFSYSISHDLRAPLRAIFGFSQILSHRHRESLNEEGKQYMGYIVEASVRMEQLINDLLNYSRLGRKSLDIRPVALGEIIKNIHLDFKQKMDEIGAVFKVNETFPVISGEESLFRQIFTNLIDNAINYRRTEVPLEISIHCENVSKGFKISVSDNGIGIPEEYWEKIFNIFQRLHSEDQYPGTGIGLATVKKAVSMLNGTIKVESIIGKGSIFIINLPEYKM